jgi:hypothetical protein
MQHYSLIISIKELVLLLLALTLQRIGYMHSSKAE